MADRMGPLDAFFVLAEEDGANHMHVGGWATVRGEPPTYQALLDHIAARLPRIPRYRQVIHEVPMRLARPVWADAERFDLTEHVHHVTLPRPGREALRGFLSDMMSGPMDRSRPLWDLWLADGLADDEWVVGWRIHHCMVGGVSGTEVLGILFDDQPEPTPGVPDNWEPATSSPGRVELVRDAVVDLVRSPVRKVAAGAEARRGRGAAVGDLTRLAKDGLRLAGRMVRMDLRSPLNGSIGPDRSYAFSTLDMDDVRHVRRVFGGTVNDVVLATILGGYHDLLVSCGHEMAGRTMRILVPVALRDRDETGQAQGDGTMMTKASGLVADLPVGEADPVARLAAVRETLDRLKGTREADVMDAFNELSGLAPSAVLAVGLRVLSKLPQRSIATVVTNVPGPRDVLYCLGGRLTHIWSYAPPFPMGARTSVGVYSYEGNLHVGVTGDRDSMPDVDVIADGTRVALAELVEAAQAIG